MAFVPDESTGGRFVPDSATTPPPAVAAAPPATTTESGYGPTHGFAIPIGETALGVGSSMLGTALGGIAGLAGTVIPGEQGQGARWSQKVQDAMAYGPRTKSAQTMMEVIGLPGQAISHVADKVGDRGAEVSPALGTIGKTSVEALPLLLGARALGKAKPLTPAEQKVAAARDAGFTMTPEEMGAGFVPRTAASLAGEPRLARTNSNKNAAVVTEKIADDLGVPKGATLDLDAAAAVRKKAGAVYDEARGVGQVTPGAQYVADLDAIGAKYSNVSKDFPSLAQTDVQAVIDGARQRTFSASGAVDLIDQLRQSADAAFAGRNTGMGKVYRGVADAVEAELGRHIQTQATVARAAGNTAVADQLASLHARYQSARTTIAKAHLAQKALIADDVINPRTYATAAQKGKPLTGAAQEVGEFGRSFERSSMKPNNMATGATFADAAMAVVNGLRGTPWIADLLTAGLRPATRAVLASRPGQWAMDPRTRLMPPVLQGAAVSSAAPQQEERR